MNLFLFFFNAVKFNQERFTDACLFLKYFLKEENFDCKSSTCH